MRMLTYMTIGATVGIAAYRYYRVWHWRRFVAQQRAQFATDEDAIDAALKRGQQRIRERLARERKARMTAAYRRMQDASRYGPVVAFDTDKGMVA